MTTPLGGGVTWEDSADLVVVGGGVAGLSAAIAAAHRGMRVLTIAKGGGSDTATQYAQGGIAVPGDASTGDSVDSHVADTCDAGGGLCIEPAVRSIVEGGAAAADTLVGLGAVFDRGADGTPARTREGGHSVRRIVHSGGDATGAEVQRALNRSGDAARSVHYETTAVRVLLASGEVVGLLVHRSDGYGVIHAPTVLLATGGAGQLYSCSTNPAGATADGIALALDAGAEVADLEFVQFHPTVLFAAGAEGRRPLVSEAVRGEGAYLVDRDGVRFMTGVHPLADLAPRDVVSRAIAERAHLIGDDHVLLDARAIERFDLRFPTVTASCLAAGIDPRHDLIPVAPAAHYSCGGIVTDTHGRTSVPGLLAAGEVARTGMHGANRLASNSLLEGLVVGERAGRAAESRLDRPTPDVAIALPSTLSVDRSRLQRSMTEWAGVVRDADGLNAVAAQLDRAEQLDGAHVDGRDGSVWEDAALTTAATALVLAATQRRESRGCHTRRDYPSSDETQQFSIHIRRDADGTFETRTPFDAPRPRAMTGVS